MNVAVPHPWNLQKKISFTILLHTQEGEEIHEMLRGRYFQVNHQIKNHITFCYNAIGAISNVLWPLKILIRLQRV